MRPLKLELTNFMSYDHTVLDLSEIHLASIVGPNGAGKSTLLQAISYALWGEVRTASHNDVVRRSTTECGVSLHFEAAGCEYIDPQRSIQGKGSSE
jgi:exonuclease SbcC